MRSDTDIQSRFIFCREGKGGQSSLHKGGLYNALSPCRGGADPCSDTQGFVTLLWTATAQLGTSHRVCRKPGGVVVLVMAKAQICGKLNLTISGNNKTAPFAVERSG